MRRKWSKPLAAILAAAVVITAMPQQRVLAEQAYEGYVSETEASESTQEKETEAEQATEIAEEGTEAETEFVEESTELTEETESAEESTELTEETEFVEESTELTEETESAEDQTTETDAVEDTEQLSATTLTEGNFSYQVSNGTATITAYTGDEQDVSIPAEIGGYAVTVIGAKVFKNKTTVTSITIPDTVKEIKTEAFYNTGITSLKLPASIEKLETLIIAKTAVTEITIPRSLKSASMSSDGLGAHGALSRCETLKKVIFEDGITTIPKVCYYCPNLTEVVIPSSVTLIDAYAFRGCSSLSSVTIPEQVKEIASEAFWGTALTSLTLPEGIETLGAGIIAKTKITEITIPKSLKESGRTADGVGSLGALSRCDTLKKVVFEDGTTTIPKVCYYSPSVTEIAIPDSVTEIDKFAFQGCTGMTEFVLPAGVTKIGADAFAANANLQRVVIYDAVTTIHSLAFEKSTQCSIVGYRNSTAETYAKENGLTFESIKYDIKFDGNGADGGNTADMNDRECGISYQLNENGFTRTGYKFKNWNSQKDGKGTSFTNEQSVSDLCPLYHAQKDSITLYAQWEPIEYHVQFDGNGADKGSMNKLTDLRYDKTYELKKNAFQRNGYNFIGWNTKKDGKGTTYADAAKVKNLTTKDGATVTLYAQWKVKGYHIKYELKGGTNSSKNPTSYNKTTKTIKLAKATKKGYTFAGWYSDKKFKNKVTQITKGSTGNKTLYAKWTANTYTIKFNSNGAKKGSTKQIQNVKYGSKAKLTKNGFERDGYEFIGWNTQKNGKGKTYKDKATVKNLTASNKKTVTLYAQWKLKEYRITYALNGGRNDSKNPVTYTVKTKTIKLSDPVRDGYQFQGWYSDSKFKNRVKTIKSGSTGNVKVYAKWKKK